MDARERFVTAARGDAFAEATVSQSDPRTRAGGPPASTTASAVIDQPPAGNDVSLDGESPQPEAAVLTVEELAAFLRVNHKTVRDAITRGEIPGVRRIGGVIRIYRQAVVSWLLSGQGRGSCSRRFR
jgi:excisionase family DNA binding protein